MRNRKPNIAGISLVFAAVLSGCASESGDDPKAPTPQQIRRVQIVDFEPANVARFSNLSATICKDNPLDVPSRDAALTLLRKRAFMNGYLTLHSVEVGSVNGALAHSCPGGIQAKGVGFTASR